MARKRKEWARMNLRLEKDTYEQLQRLVALSGESVPVATFVREAIEMSVRNAPLVVQLIQSIQAAERASTEMALEQLAGIMQQSKEEIEHLAEERLVEAEARLAVAHAEHGDADELANEREGDEGGHGDNY